MELLLDQISSRYLTWDGLWLEERTFQDFWLGNGEVGSSQPLPAVVAVIVQALAEQEGRAQEQIAVAQAADPAGETDSTGVRVRLLTDIVYGIKQGKAPFVLKEWHTDFESYDILTQDSPGVSVWIPLGPVDDVKEVKYTQEKH